MESIKHTKETQCSCQALCTIDRTIGLVRLFIRHVCTHVCIIVSSGRLRFLHPFHASSKTHIALHLPFQDAIESGRKTLKVGASKGHEVHLMR